jgi:hypothetical protein
MKLRQAYSIAIVIGVLFGAAATAARARIFESDQSVLRAQYVEKVLIFRNCYRMIDKLEVLEDGTVKGKAQPGYWAVDGAFQVKTLTFGNDRVSLTGIKLWTDIQKDGVLHYFPASAALNGKGDYPSGLEVIFRTGVEVETAAQFTARVDRIFFNEQETKLDSAPAPIARYIRNEAVKVDIDPASGTGFKGTPPKPVSTPQPYLSHEASLVGQTGTENFIVLVDEQGRGSVDGFTNVLQYGLEEATMEAVKKWKFQPATLNGKPVPLRIAMNIKYRSAPNPWITGGMPEGYFPRDGVGGLPACSSCGRR